MKKVLLIILLLLVSGSLIIYFSKREVKKQVTFKKGVPKTSMKINITIDDKTFEGVLEDNKTTEEFIKVLPLDINMEDLNDNEKYYYFNTSFPTESKNYKEIKRGDIMLFGDNCLVIFYEDHTSYYDYTKIGKINNTEGLKEILKNNKNKIKIELK